MENVNNEDPKLDNTITSPPPLEKAEEQPTTQTSIRIDRPNEKNEQNNNRENKPLSLFEALLLLIILAIPLINILFLLRWSFRKGVNRNKKNIARI